MAVVVPTVFAESKEAFDARLSRLAPIAKRLHVDVMDGLFVTPHSIAPEYLPDFSDFEQSIDAHLMVRHPENYFEVLAMKGVQNVICHVETIGTVSQVQEVARRAKDAGLVFVLAKNPVTPVRRFLEYAPTTNDFLFMGHHPGEEGVPFNERIYGEIERFLEAQPDKHVHVDGGVDRDVAIRLAELGVSVINCGSYINESDDPQKRLDDLQREVDAHAQ